MWKKRSIILCSIYVCIELLKHPYMPIIVFPFGICYVMQRRETQIRNNIPKKFKRYELYWVFYFLCFGYLSLGHFKTWFCHQALEPGFVVEPEQCLHSLLMGFYISQLWVLLYVFLTLFLYLGWVGCILPLSCFLIAVSCLESHSWEGQLYTTLK